jgi:hypothetical protein
MQERRERRQQTLAAFDARQKREASTGWAQRFDRARDDFYAARTRLSGRLNDILGDSRRHSQA